MTNEQVIKVIEDLIQLAKDYAADEGTDASNDQEILNGIKAIQHLKQDR